MRSLGSQTCVSRTDVRYILIYFAVSQREPLGAGTMEPGAGFLFIQETGNKPHEKRVKSDIKMHVADRMVTQKRVRQKRRGEGSRELRVRGGDGNQDDVER